MKTHRIIFALLAIFICTMATFAQKYDRGQGIDLFRSGEYAKALPILQGRVAEENRDRLAWIYLGAVNVKLGKLEEAKLAFQNHKQRYAENVPVYDKKLKIIKIPRAAHTDKAFRSGTTGVVSVAVEMLSNGTIGFVLPLNDLANGLTESAVKAANAISFAPPIRDGKPLTTVTVLEYSFL